LREGVVANTALLVVIWAGGALCQEQPLVSGKRSLTLFRQLPNPAINAVILVSHMVYYQYSLSGESYMAVKASKSIGTATKDNLAGWANYAKHPTNFTDHQSVGGVKMDGDWKQTQRKEEGRGWTKASVTDNTHTGKK